MDHDKCWICLGTDREDWRKVCKCNLWVHESCILQWARTDLGQDGTRCPQCRSPIAIEGQRSNLLELNQLATTLGTVLLGGAAATAALAGVFEQAFQLMFEHGTQTIRALCSPELAESVLGGPEARTFLFRWGRSMFSQGVGLGESLRLSPNLNNLWRQIYIPIIPSLLLNSRGRMNSAATMLATSLLMVLPPSRPLAATAALFAVYPIYGRLWSAFEAPYLRSLAAQVYEETRKDEYTAAVAQLEQLIDGAIHPEGGQQEGEGEGEQQEGNEPIPINPQEQLEYADQFFEALGEVVDVQNHRSGRFLLGKRSLLLDKINALALPFYSRALGNLLARIPTLGAWDPLYRNYLAMALLVVGRDVWRLVLAGQRARVETRRHVPNYGESNGSQRPLWLRLLRALVLPVERLRNIVNIDVRFA